MLTDFWTNEWSRKKSLKPTNSPKEDSKRIKKTTFGVRNINLKKILNKVCWIRNITLRFKTTKFKFINFFAKKYQGTFL